MPNPLPKRSFIKKAVDKVSDVTAGVAFGAYKNNARAKLSEQRRNIIQKARGIPASIVEQSDHRDPAFRAKVNAINVKTDMMREAANAKADAARGAARGATKGLGQKLRAKFLKNGKK